ncbi:DNA polymerase III subunit gamma and tau [Microbacterium sp. 2FI]|uniref:DNA polymerase III subunit gamma and tau n=1 Tax=Microbacterium sp. 2FI TaxID=2502193 RepID=UPI0010F9A386|nr:DNA polymerase III subunit gamma and tau [Microbacterium sp. 2FI]
MTTALYRRYRPESFGEMIGQSQVTEPLMTALRGDRVGHAYLFSGPRGCGKTTSARILARCLNCAAGPTDTPCGTCDSCVELGRGGGGSLDVVEIDAASHNGVDDARDLRERAVFAPARDRFKIFILDEAHMVTPQGFNALLKLVEEPPDHVKFIFATTEPEKVIGTIRSRTHHYPFRLVPPAAMLEYVQELCATEGVEVEAGVLPLVVRAGGGSPRDTLSLLDQLIAGSEDSRVAYARAVSLLGYTHAELLDEVVDAFGAGDAAAAFAAVDRVVQTGQDPRRFVDDLLERLRDLIVVAATGQGAASVLRGLSAEDLARMQRQADTYGASRLSHTADLVIATLDDMTGATSPRLQLELMVARVLARGADAAATPVAAPPVAAPVAAAPPVVAPDATPAQPSAAPAAPVPSGPVTLQRLRDAWPEVLGNLEGISRSSWLLASGASVSSLAGDVLTLSFQSQADVAKFKHLAAGKGPSEDLRQAIIAVLGLRVKYLAKYEPGAGHPDEPPPPDDEPPPAPEDPSAPPVGRSAPATVPPAKQARPARSAPAADRPESARASDAPAPRPSAAAAAPVTEWAVAPIPTDADAPPPDPAPDARSQFAVDDEPEDAAGAASAVRIATLAPPREGEVLPTAEVAVSVDPDEAEDAPVEIAVDAPVPPVIAPPLPPAAATRSDGVQRYGEAVIRQVLGATFIREEPYEQPTRFS